jgi:predicted GH43/DUF377 family glycosyl hydrolase
VGPTPPFGKWTRLSAEPILSPSGDGFESAGTFNPAVVEKDGKFVMLYRAQDRSGKSSLGYATSSDGVHFTKRTEPVSGVRAHPMKKGVEWKIRVCRKFGDTYYLTYTGYNNVDGGGSDHKDAQLCLATSKDLIHWDRKGVIMPSYKGKWNVKWTKSGAIVPEQINGKYWMYYLGDAKGQDTQMGVASSDDLVHWTDVLDHPVMASRPGMFDSQVEEPGPPPVITPAGIFSDLQRSGRQAGLFDGLGSLRQERSHQSNRTRQSAGIRTREGVGESGSDPERSIRRGFSARWQTLAFLLWWCRQIRRCRNRTNTLKDLYDMEQQIR